MMWLIVVLLGLIAASVSWRAARRSFSVTSATVASSAASSWPASTVMATPWAPPPMLMGPSIEASATTASRPGCRAA